MDYLVIALTLGSVYASLAIGYALIYCCLRLINFAHGEFATFGAYATLLLAVHLHVNNWLAVCVGVITGGIVAVITWYVAYRPLRFASRTSGILAALGASICLQQVLARTCGAQSRAFPRILGDTALVQGTLHIDALGVFAIASAVLLLGLTHVVWMHSRAGLLIRSVADDREAAECVGINADRVVMLTFLGAGMAAGVAGVVLASFFGRVEPTMGFGPALKAFVAALVGGLKDPRRAALGGLLLGLAETATISVGLSAYREAMVLGLLVTVLLVQARRQARQVLPVDWLAVRD